MSRFLRHHIVLVCLFLVACSGGEDRPPSAQASQVAVVAQQPGATPFIATLTIGVDRYEELASADFTVGARPGTWSRPVSVSYAKSWLDRNGAFNIAGNRLSLTIFGLYADYLNDVSVVLRFTDGSSQTQRVALRTPAYAGPAALYQAPAIKVARGPGSAPGFDFIFIKNRIATPAVIDTDGNLRWVGNALPESLSSIFVGDSFFVGSATSPSLSRVRLDGSAIAMPLVSTQYSNFHHDFTLGKAGLLAEFDTVVNNFPNGGAILAEISPDGVVLKQWDLAAIFRDYMLAHGDNPYNFVRAGTDWFHMNSAIYDPRDDTLLVSSRENFVAKIGYENGDIRWLFGDTTKHWYVDYPSLRALALKLTAGKAPVGQHSLSITVNGELLMFNNGLGSLNHPPGTSPGITRQYSTPSRYAIDEGAKTAQEVWSYDHMPTINSDVCSSVYESGPGNYLLAYAAADGRTKATLAGVNAAGTVAFEFDYPTGMCGTVFIAQPIAFDALQLK
jgi:hypothetical protein